MRVSVLVILVSLFCLSAYAGVHKQCGIAPSVVTCPDQKFKDPGCAVDCSDTVPGVAICIPASCENIDVGNGAVSKIVHPLSQCWCPSFSDVTSK